MAKAAAKAGEAAKAVVPGAAEKEEASAPKAAAAPKPVYKPPAVKAVEAPVMWNHGVASGDPLPDAIILWTRATPIEGAPEAIKVTWEVREADGGNSSKPVAEGATDARADRDYTVKVDVAGVLKPRVKYLFSFKACGLSSPEGHFRLPPPRNEPLEKLMYAIFSCANWRWGHFQAYGAAARYDLDFTLHLGDFIYENGLELYPNDEQAVRESLDPPHELFSLEDYRKRYALHRGDANLQALSAAAPMIAIWDDHEVANNAWKNGAAEHEAFDGTYGARREAALRAYHEWMPTRIDLHARGEDLWMHSHRSFDFGNLAKLVALEMRHKGRDAQTALTRGSVSKQLADVIHASGYPPKDKAHARFFDVMLRAVKSQVEAARRKPTREMLGFAQRSWVAEQARNFEADGQGWFLVMQPLVMQELLAADHLKAIQEAVRQKNPDAADWIKQIESASGLQLTANGTIAAQRLQHHEMTDAHRKAQVDLVAGRHGIPLDFDSWNGYLAAKERLVGILETAGRGRSVVYGGDSHNAWAGAVLNRSGHGVAVEFDCQSVSSPGQEFYRPWTTPELEASAWRAANPALAYTNVHQRGFMVVELNQTGHHVEFLAVNTTADASVKAECISAFGVLSGHVGLHNATCRDAPPAFVGDDEEPPPREMVECDFDQPEVTLSEPEEDEFEEFELDSDSE